MDTDPKTYGIGIAGCGAISGTHVEAIRGTKYGNLGAVHSRSQPEFDTFCSQYGGGSGFANCEKFLSQIVEKPIKVTLERGRKLHKI